MFEKLESCPICGSTDYHNHLICKDHSISQEEFAIVKCNNCGFLFTNPRPTYSSIDKYYQSDKYISHANQSTGIINFIYKIARNFTLRKKLRLTQSYSGPGSLLDVGCGTGHFLDICEKHYWNVEGVEPNINASKVAQHKVQGKIYNNLYDIKGKQYDVITLWHVLEHVHDLNNYIIKIKTLLHKHSILIVAVPNYNSYDANYYKKYWAGYDVPRHLYHFEQKTMIILMKNHKLKVKNILPMKLDAYYVSLLSEQYQHHGLKSYFNSLVTGYRSNSQALELNNFSSLIYVIKQ